MPVSDVDRAKEFYGGLGWRLDADVARGEDFRLVQFTPPCSGCSIQFGTNITSAAPGSAQSLYLAVPDIEAARNELLARGVEVGEVFHEAGAGRSLPRPRPCARAGARPRHLRLVRRVQRSGRQRLAAPRDHDAAAGSLKGEADGHDIRVRGRSGGRAQASAEAHGKHEERTGQADANWPDWYALYMVRERAGEELPT